MPGEDPAKCDIPFEQRWYLIVYYVPIERDKKGKKGEANKKRSRADSLAAVASSASPKAKGIPKGSFSVNARLVSYGDFLGTGVRLPSEGLTITGPVAEAMASLPAKLVDQDRPHDAIIGICSGRDRDIEFDPEGLKEVGLCQPVVEEHQVQQPPSPVHEEEMMDQFDPVHAITPIGRAVVEMAWLGCLAITFSDVPPPQAK